MAKDPKNPAAPDMAGTTPEPARQAPPVSQVGQQQTAGAQAGSHQLAQGLSPDAILQAFAALQQFGQPALAFIEALVKAFRNQPALTRASAHKPVACPAGEECCDELINSLAQSFACALKCKECCQGE